MILDLPFWESLCPWTELVWWGRLVWEQVVAVGASLDLCCMVKASHSASLARGC